MPSLHATNRRELHQYFLEFNYQPGGCFGYFFFCSGEGRGESEAPGGGGGCSFLEIPEGEISQEKRPGADGHEGMCGEFWGGGGGKYFFSGRNSHQGNHFVTKRLGMSLLLPEVSRKWGSWE